jgi:hypothetical protein
MISNLYWRKFFEEIIIHFEFTRIGKNFWEIKNAKLLLLFKSIECRNFSYSFYWNKMTDIDSNAFALLIDYIMNCN